jgi:hypothetical protein
MSIVEQEVERVCTALVEEVEKHSAAQEQKDAVPTPQTPPTLPEIPPTLPETQIPRLKPTELPVSRAVPEAVAPTPPVKEPQIQVVEARSAPEKQPPPPILDGPQEIPFGKANGNGTKKVTVVDIEQIRDAASLGDVVVYLYEKGVDSVSDLVAKCHELRGDIPLLSKISNLSQRVAKACEVKGLDVRS